jgi:shikimate kinase
MSGMVLIGFMGTGKTAVGQRLAEQLGLEFIDLDALIEKKMGISISNIFREYGESYFRRIEKQTVNEICRRNDLVVATGGGVVLDRENIINLKKMGLLIHLVAQPEVVLDRIANDRQRPLMEVKDRQRRIEALMSKRTPFYECADVEIDTSELSIQEVADRIKNILGESGHGRSES